MLRFLRAHTQALRGRQDFRRALTADDPKMADEAIDVWLKPYERPSDRAAAMREYLAWEVDLPVRIARDGSANFIQFGA